MGLGPQNSHFWGVRILRLVTSDLACSYSKTSIFFSGDGVFYMCEGRTPLVFSCLGGWSSTQLIVGVLYTHYTNSP